MIYTVCINGYATRMDILEQLSDAIMKSGVSRYRISEDTDVSPTVLHRIVSGTGGCNLETLNSLCEYLGLELKPKKRGK